MDDLALFCCQNPDCPLYGHRDAGNLSVCGRLGKHKQYRQLRCNECRARFSERKGTPLYRCHLPEKTAVSVLEHLAEGAASDRPGASSAFTVTPYCDMPASAGDMLTTLTKSSWLFPPQTREVQFDEKWSFVAKKQKHCEATATADIHKGEWWDHVAYDPEHRLVLAVVPGARSIENAEAVVAAAQGRTEGAAPRLMTSDEYPAYASAIEAAFGVPVTEAKAGRGRPRIVPERRLPTGSVYATVHKEREKDRVVSVERRLVFGTEADLEAALGGSSVSRMVNTSFVERRHATDRGQNARKSRKTYRFSKDWRAHEAMTYYTLYRYNFCWPVRTSRRRDDDGRWRPRTPAMAAGLTDHVWSAGEWARFPTAQSVQVA